MFALPNSNLSTGCEIYQKTFWTNVEEGQEVFLEGTALSNFHRKKKMYGPFTVAEVKNRVLKNAKGWRFMHYPEELYVKI